MDMLKSLTNTFGSLCPKRYLLGSYDSEYGLLTSCINVTRQFVRNVESHDLPKPTESETLFIRGSGDLCTY